jgi:hypothetical protein
MTIQAHPAATSYAILDTARRQVPGDATGFTEDQLVKSSNCPTKPWPPPCNWPTKYG